MLKKKIPEESFIIFENDKPHTHVILVAIINVTIFMGNLKFVEQNCFLGVGMGRPKRLLR